MKLTIQFLQSNPILTTRFVDSTVTDKQVFFQQLKSVASADLALAHSVFKVSACRTVLSLSKADLLQKLTRRDFISGFSVQKSFDTVYVNSDRAAVGKKHWISNLSQAEFIIMQAPDQTGDVALFFTNLKDLGDFSFTKDFSFLTTPGMVDTCTGDVDFNFHPVIPIFSKRDQRYFVSNNHNSLCFITNYLGGVEGLLQLLSTIPAEFRSRHKILLGLLDHELSSTSGQTTSSDAFWHARNALYLESKRLMVELCQYIIEHSAAEFYNLESQHGRHFFDCLIFSGHNGPLSRSYQELHTQSYDY